MPRPPEGRKQITANPKEELRVKLGQKLIDMGYAHIREGVALPAWTEFLEAIANDEIILYKKVD